MAATDEIDMSAAATLVVVWRTGRNAHGRVVKAGGQVIDTLRGYAMGALQRISDGSGCQYDPNDEQDNECAYLTANRDELLDTSILDQLDTGASLPSVAPGGLRGRTLALYALLIGNDPDARVAFVRKGNPVRLAGKGLVATFFDETLTRVTQPVLAFDQNFDVIVRLHAVWVLHQANFESLFRESEAVLARTAEWVDGLSNSLPVSDESKEWLATRLRQTSVLRRKVRSILQSPYLSKLTPEVMRQKMKERGLNPDELIRDGALVFNKETEKSVLLFLNEDLWTGDFSGEQYAATRKSRRAA
jgi:hypothetical protein